MNRIASPQEKLWHKSFVVLFLMNLCQFISFHMQVATFSFFIKDLGGNDAVAGLASGMFSIAALATRPFAGRLFDRHSKKMTFFIGLAGMLALPLSYISIRIIALLLMLRLLHGVFWSMSSTAVNSEVVGIIPRKRFSEGMGYFGVTAALSMSVSPALGLSVMNRWGFTAMFLLAAGMSAAAIGLAFVYGVGKQAPPPAAAPSKSGLAAFVRSLFAKEALPASIIIFFCLIPHGAIMTFIALYARDNGLGDGGGFFMFMAAATILMRVSTGKISDRNGEKSAVYASASCIGLSTVLLGLYPHPLAFYGAAVLYGMGFGMITPAMQAMALRTAPADKRGAATSTYLCAFDLGIGCGGILAGLLVDAFGSYAHMYLALCLTTILAAAYYLFWGSKSPSAFRNCTPRP
ncbi:MAG: MFS transporter [Firmicutes bacterium]|nr:MFS transporter [Bacillota bacterium]